MATFTVLIVSTEPIIGALLALYVEVHNYRAVLADERKSPESEVQQSGASLILVDVDHRDGFSPAFVARQRSAGRRVIAFSPKYLANEVRERAATLQLPSFALPIEPEQFRALLDEAASRTTASTRRAIAPESRA
jgi:DNA-binding response OmpR family regulator